MSWTELLLPQQVEGVMWFVVAGFSFILAVLSFRRYKKSQVQSRPFFLGLAVFTSTYGVARLLENIRKYFIALSLTDIADAWRANSQITGSTCNYVLVIL